MKKSNYGIYVNLFEKNYFELTRDEIKLIPNISNITL